MTYNNIGQLAGASLGNGVSESYGYDANRMQLTSQIATKSGGPTGGLMNLTYGYQASAGQMGVGSTAGNAGQLMSISGTIGGLTESAAYTYDDLGRLVTSNQTSNSASAQRRFAYDQWGNRTGEWDATSGGNQIQSVVLQQSGGTPTTRLTSVTTSGVTANYTYDSAGNVTNDGAHSYMYDAENRIVNVDGGATGQYSYDASNQRYKKVTGGATTHYIWEGSQVIAEYDGSTGAVTAEYVYSGSRMIAKIASSTTQYFLSDRLSTRLVLDASGNVIGRQAHLPFGEDFGESGSQEKHHFTSYERDGENGADYAVNRYYDGSNGRFRSIDPARLGAKSSQSSSRCSSGGRTESIILKHPQLANGFQYAAADPINRGDRVGLSVVCFIDFVPNADPDDIGDPFAGDLVFGGCFRSTSEGGRSGGCHCQGTTDCSLYDTLCENAKKKGLSKAAIDYYCKRAPKACNSAPKSGFLSCTSNCIRRCLQDYEKARTCFNIPDPVGDQFLACEALAHGECYEGCVLKCAL